MSRVSVTFASVVYRSTMNKSDFYSTFGYVLISKGHFVETKPVAHA